MVTRETIATIRAGAVECSDEILEKEFESFFKKQPALCDFVMELTSTGRQSVGELALYLSYIVYEALLVEGAGSLDEVTGQEIAHACHESEHWVHRMSESQAAELPSSTLSDLGDEPHLISYVISEVHDAATGGLDLTPEENGAVFFVLTAVIASLTTD